MERQKFQYVLLTLGPFELTMDMLQNYGREGWEVVQVEFDSTCPSKIKNAFLKRPYTNEDTA